MDKHSSLLQKYVNYGRKFFLKHWALNQKSVIPVIAFAPLQVILYNPSPNSCSKDVFQSAALSLRTTADVLYLYLLFI
jgi:hypothetical protein